MELGDLIAMHESSIGHMEDMWYTIRGALGMRTLGYQITMEKGALD